MNEVILYARNGAFTQEQREIINFTKPDNKLDALIDWYNATPARKSDYNAEPYKLRELNTSLSVLQENVPNINEIEDDYCILDLSTETKIPGDFIGWLWPRMFHIASNPNPIEIAREYISDRYFNPVGYFNLFNFHERDKVAAIAYEAKALIALLRAARRFYISRSTSKGEPMLQLDHTGLLFIATMSAQTPLKLPVKET